MLLNSTLTHELSFLISFVDPLLSLGTHQDLTYLTRPISHSITTLVGTDINLKCQKSYKTRCCDKKGKINKKDPFSSASPSSTQDKAVNINSTQSSTTNTNKEANINDNVVKITRRCHFITGILSLLMRQKLSYQILSKSEGLAMFFINSRRVTLGELIHSICQVLKSRSSSLLVFQDSKSKNLNKALQIMFANSLVYEKKLWLSYLMIELELKADRKEMVINKASLTNNKSPKYRGSLLKEGLEDESENQEDCSTSSESSGNSRDPNSKNTSGEKPERIATKSSLPDSKSTTSSYQNHDCDKVSQFEFFDTYNGCSFGNLEIYFDPIDKTLNEDEQNIVFENIIAKPVYVPPKVETAWSKGKYYKTYEPKPRTQSDSMTIEVPLFRMPKPIQTLNLTSKTPEPISVSFDHTYQPTSARLGPSNKHSSKLQIPKKAKIEQPSLSNADSRDKSAESDYGFLSERTKKMESSSPTHKGKKLNDALDKKPSATTRKKAASNKSKNNDNNGGLKLWDKISVKGKLKV